ncbi:predicted protein [Postia placenta Mad-698-R]|nr:predicted protein [Postia placenta Mad-698-R]
MSLPQIQKAWRATAKGEPSKVLRLDDNVPVPKLNRGEVLIKVQAAALNPVAYKVIMKLIPNFILKKPYIPEHDLAGIVVDANDTEFQNGDEVFGFIPVSAAVKERKGALAQYASISASHIVRRPVNVTPTQAAGIPLAAMTAYQALFDVAHLKPEQHVFINGGSTAVGGFAIQIAKSIGCKVVASASGKNEGYVRSLGADEFVDYTTGPLHATLAANPPSQKYHVFLETVGLLDTSLYTSSEAYLAPGGIFVSTGPQPKGFDIAGLSRLAWKIFLQPRWLGGTKRTWKLIQVDNKHEDLVKVAEQVVDGKIKPLVDSVYNFDDALKAYERIMTGRATGKVVVKVDLETE